MDIKFNKKVVSSLTKEQFKEMHQHFANELDLDAEYDKIVPPAKAEETKALPQPETEKVEE